MPHTGPLNLIIHLECALEQHYIPCCWKRCIIDIIHPTAVTVTPVMTNERLTLEMAFRHRSGPFSRTGFIATLSYITSKSWTVFFQSFLMVHNCDSATNQQSPVSSLLSWIRLCHLVDHDFLWSPVLDFSPKSSGNLFTNPEYTEV